MIIRILVVLLICIIVIFIGYWLLTGGISRGISISNALDNPFSFFFSTTSGALITLPWQPRELLPGVDISQYTEDPNSPSTQTQADRLNDLQRQYDELYAKVRDPKNFGSPSPYRDQVTIGMHNAKEAAATGEYLTLQAAYKNTAPVPLTGWSLQSAVTGIRVAIPPAAPTFTSGVLNSVATVVLEPGGAAIVVSGTSPVGVSFRENRCSGYLGEMQKFIPTIDRHCPLAQDELPITADNIRIYGDECVDYVKKIPICHFPGTDPVVPMSDTCKQFLLNRLSYNGCLYAHKNDPGFLSNQWRLYLASSVQLWRDTHDVIRLLDDQGRTVDVLTY